MIRIDRSAVLPPQVLEATDGAGQRERDANELANTAGHELIFDAYRNSAVKEALREAFASKCCFCESDFEGTQPGDAEHFRPKGVVVVHNHDRTTHVQKPGYYWLAARWSNLLLSCIECNRKRTQYDEDGNRRVFGKQNFFPLQNEAVRASSPGREVHEQPLLLNPCVDEPEDHLEFMDNGRVRPKLIGGVRSERGEATIYYLGLQRAQLLSARRKHAFFVRSIVRTCMEKLLENRALGESFDELQSLLCPSSPHVAYTRHLVRSLMGDDLDSLGLRLR